jgi:hypothetical protein
MGECPDIELLVLRLAIDALACRVAIAIAPTSRASDIRATMLRLHGDLRPLAEHSDDVDAALDVIVRADCDEEDTLDLERVAHRLTCLRRRISVLAKTIAP